MKYFLDTNIISYLLQKNDKGGVNYERYGI